MVGGYGGIVIATNVSTEWIQQINLDNETGRIVDTVVRNLSLQDAGICWS